MEKTLLIIADGYSDPDSRCYEYHLLVAATGEHLASHICSDERYAVGDLYHRRDPVRNRFKPEDIEIQFLRDTALTREELLERNRKFYNLESKE